MATTSLAPAPRAISPQAWLRANLFNSPLNTVLTLLVVAVLALVVPRIFNWAVTTAVFAPDPVACRATKGACWGFIVEKLRLMTFGTYPYEQQWRPLVMMVLLVALVVGSLGGWLRGRALWLSWLAGVPVLFMLMRGGAIEVQPVVGGIVLLVIGWLNFGHRIGFAPSNRQRIAALLAIGLLAVLGWLLPLPALSIPTGLPYVETSKWGGLPLTLILSVAGIVLSFPLAVALALGRRSELPALRALSVAYIELVRGVPLITVLFMANLMIPLFLPSGITIDNLLRVQIGFILFAAAYVAEVIRGGLQAIPKGQYEAADALGLSYWHKMGFIILPQALKLVIPPMVNTFIGFFKDTSLVIIIGLFDLLGAVRLASSDVEWRPFYIEGLVFVGLIYFVFCYAMAAYSSRLERRLDTSHTRVADPA